MAVLVRRLACVAVAASCLWTQLAWAEDEEEDSPAEAEEAGAEEEGGADKLRDQSKELLEKLGQLRQLIKAKGDKVTPDELASLKKLEKLLGDTFGGGGELGDLSLGGANSKEVTEYFTSCVVLALGRSTGSARAGAMGSLRRLADGKLTPQQASETDFFKMTVSCLNRLTDAEYDQFKAGTLKQLPLEYVEASKKPEAKDEVVNAEASFWTELTVVAKALKLEEPPLPGSSVPTWVLPIIGLPVFGGITFLILRLLNQQDEKERRKEEKAEKKAKKKN